MFEETLLEVLVALVKGALALIYAGGFLEEKPFPRRGRQFLWCVLYCAGELLWSQVASREPRFNFFGFLPLGLLLYGLLNGFFVHDRWRGLFVTASFVAGWEILKFTASPLAFLLFSVLGGFMEWLMQQDFFLRAAESGTLLTAVETAWRFWQIAVLFLARFIQLVLFGGYLRFMRRRFVQRDYPLCFPESLFLLLPCLTVLGLALTLRLMLTPDESGLPGLLFERAPATTLLLPLVSVLLLGVMAEAVMLFQHLAEAREEEQKRLLLENRVSEVQREVEEVQDIYADIRGLRHDLRKHLACLAALPRSAVESGEWAGYIDRMRATVERLDFAYQTGNPILDVILHQSAQRAKRKDIAFTAAVVFPAGQGIDAYDLGVILNNALQNALEAVDKAAGRREIEVRTFRKSGLFFLEVENDFAGPFTLPPDGVLPATTKPDKALHGLGLANIQRCARKYQGDIDIAVTEEAGRKRFRLTVMLLPGKDKQAEIKL